jgi:RNA polymerase sigma-32 factor
MRQLVEAARKAPLLEREEEYDLARRWREQNDSSALHRLTTAHMRLVIALASRFRGYGLPLPDLVQEGYIGLLEAARRFEPQRDVRFATYATWWVRAALQDYVLRNWSIVRGGTSSPQKALFFNLRRMRAEADRRQQAEPQPQPSDVHESIATALGVAKADVVMMEARLSGPDMSLNMPINGGMLEGAEHGDFLIDESPLPDECISNAVDSERRRSWLSAALEALDERERSIIEARRLHEKADTLERLGSRFGISKERVRQIEHRAIEKLRTTMMARQPQAFEATSSQSA